MSLSNTSMVLLLLSDVLGVVSIVEGILVSRNPKQSTMSIILEYFLMGIFWFITGQLISRGYLDSDPFAIVSLIFAGEIVHYLVNPKVFALSSKKRTTSAQKKFVKNDLEEEFLDLTDAQQIQRLRELEHAEKIAKDLGYNQQAVAKIIKEQGQDALKEYPDQNSSANTDTLDKEKDTSQ